MSDHDLQLWEPIVELAKTRERAGRGLLIIDAGTGPYAVLELRVVCAGVVVAAFKQRKKRGGLDIEDAYVIEARIPREVLAALDAKTDAPLDALARCQTRMETTANLALKKIAPPSWAVELRAGT